MSVKKTISSALGVAIATLVAPHALAQQYDEPVKTSTNKLIIKYASPVDTRSLGSDPLLLRAIGGDIESVRTIGTGAMVIDIGADRPIEEMEALAEDIASEYGVLYAEPDYIMHHQRVPNDPKYNQQWHYFEAAGGINLPAAWDISTGSASVRIAVIDTGSRPHVDLLSNTLPGYDFISDAGKALDGNGRDSDATDVGDYTPKGACGNGEPAQDRGSSWHGTHVAGTIAAATNNGVGIAGVNWNSKIVPVRVLGRCGGLTSDIVDGMLWAAGQSVQNVPANPNPAQVLNLSLGGGRTCSNTYQSAINTIRNAGSTIVVAAGNSNANAANFTPASCNGVINVAATNRQGARANYSNYGSSVDVAAPGGEASTASNGVLSTLNDGANTPGSDSYEFYQGTSMAAPHVAGVVSLMYSVKPSITPTEVEAILKSSSRTFPQVSGRQCTVALCGDGIIDAGAALAALQPQTTNPPPGAGNDSELNNGEPKTGLSASKGQTLKFTISLPAGASNFKVRTTGSNGDADLFVKKGRVATRDNADCRKETNSSSESCSSFSQVGGSVWHISVFAYDGFSNLSLVAEYQEASSVVPVSTLTFENTNSQAIPDNNTNGITSEIDSTATITAGSVAVKVNTTHSYRGDIRLTLIAPNGSEFKVKDNNNDGADNINETYTVNVNNINAQGKWKLKVSDHYRSDRGTLNRWSITFK